jgi:hypothetical protein
VADTDAKILQFRPPATRPAASAAADRRRTPSAERDRYARARAGQEAEQLLAGGRIVPARITLALNAGGHGGPAVDLACGTFEGNPDGDVDDWELALAVPTADQVRKLAALTGNSVAWFYEPLPPGPLGSPVHICERGRRHQLVDPDVIDADGVLLYGGKPRTHPNPQGALF